MKKGISFLLAMILVGIVLCPANLRVPAAAAEEFEFEDDFGDAPDDGEAEDVGEDIYTGPEYDYDHLVIGNPTPLSGNFTTQMWGYIMVGKKQALLSNK